MTTEQHTYYYFLGIGGIGMSALARYFNFKGACVFGYDKTSSDLTKKLESEGIRIHYTDEVSQIPQEIIEHKDNTLVIFTPAIPQDNKELNFLKDSQYTFSKRAQVLGTLCNNQNGIAIAGTHGKTSVTTFTTHLFYNSHVGCSAFLGGISKNFNSNFVYHATSEYVVVEADEYDRSFHNLFPHTALITSIDADHLDIYGSFEKIQESFNQFAEQINDNGTLIYKRKLKLEPILEGLHERGIR
jgi:UDP-N-acetylmuramate--alanine ligase